MTDAWRPAIMGGCDARITLRGSRRWAVSHRLGPKCGRRSARYRIDGTGLTLELHLCATHRSQYKRLYPAATFTQLFEPGDPNALPKTETA
jgi:hypothetical protein